MFWHLLVLQLLLYVAEGSDDNQSHEARASMVTATIDPHQPLVWSGGRVTLTCSLSNSSVNVNASDFYFYSSSQELRERLQWERINRTTIRTNVTGINRNMSSENISCRFQNETLDQVTLLVSDRIQCVVMNWQSMVCTWEKFQFNDDVNFTLIYSRGKCEKEKHICPYMMSNKTHGKCVWNHSQFYMHTSHCLSLKIQGPSSTPLFKAIGFIDVSSIVKPNPVSNCQINSPNANHSVILAWASPNKDYEFIYRVTLISKWSAFTENTSKTVMLLDNLIPYTNYTATVDCISLRRGRAAGFWSDPNSMTFVSASDVPGATPRVTPGGYQETSLNTSHRRIELFFQPPDERYSHGEIKDYRVNYSLTDSLNKSFSVKSEAKISTNIVLESYADYRLTVEAETETGYNSSLTQDPIFISSQLKKLSFPKQFVVKGDGYGSYFLSWNSMNNVSSYTLYWCSGSLRPSLCLDMLQWKTFLPNQTSAELKVIGLHGKILRFFISAEKVLYIGHVISSGMLMSNCTYMLNGDLKPPNDFHVSKVGSSSLIAEWSQPDEASCQRRGYPDAYIIAYCVINKCLHKNETFRVNSSFDSFQINDLKPGTTYSVMIKSISEDGKESRFEKRNETMEVDISSQNDNLIIIVISIIGGVLCILCVVIGLACYLHRWVKNKFFDIQITTPERYRATNIGKPSETGCYSYFDSSTGQIPYAAHTPGRYTGEIQDLLPRKQTFSVSSSCRTNETSLLSSSSIETAKSDNVSVKSGNIAGYNKVVERPCLLASGSQSDSGSSFPNSDNLSESVDDAVFISSLDP